MEESAGTCPNCGTPWGGVQPNFCSQCGQETRLEGPGWAASVRLWLARYAHTLAVLAFRPGRITVDHLAGRRQRYVPPWRLYLHLSFLFFVVVRLLPDTTPQAVHVRLDEEPPVVAEAPAARRDKARPAAARCQPVGQAPCNAVERTFAVGLDRFERDPRGATAAFRERFATAAPYAAFVLLPLVGNAGAGGGDRPGLFARAGRGEPVARGGGVPLGLSRGRPPTIRSSPALRRRP